MEEKCKNIVRDSLFELSSKEYMVITKVYDVIKSYVECIRDTVNRYVKTKSLLEAYVEIKMIGGVNQIESEVGSKIVMKKSSMGEVKKLFWGGWIFYLSGEESCLDRHKCGKWMHFFNNKEFAVHICEEAVANCICIEAKHTDAGEGVYCFYLNCDDVEGHKRVLSYFIGNDLIRKTKTGKLYNIFF